MHTNAQHIALLSIFRMGYNYLKRAYVQSHEYSDLSFVSIYIIQILLHLNFFIKATYILVSSTWHTFANWLKVCGIDEILLQFYIQKPKCNFVFYSTYYLPQPRHIISAFIFWGFFCAFYKCIIIYDTELLLRCLTVVLRTCLLYRRTRDEF